MSGFVLDASTALSWIFEDESNDLSDRALAELISGFAFVPALWFVELANGLATGVRRSRLSAEEAGEFARDIGALDIRADPDPTDPLVLASRALATGLSAYDAAYLDLAQRLALPLATHDTRLAEAAVAAGVAVIGSPPYDLGEMHRIDDAAFAGTIRFMTATSIDPSDIADTLTANDLSIQ